MYVFLFAFMVVLAVTHAEEPLYCKFRYDEALLEKVIRNELQFEQLQSEVRVTLSRVESTLKDIHETNRNMNDKFIHLNETTFDKVGEFVKDSTGRIKNLTESLSTPIIGFKATGIKNISPSGGEVLVFPTVLSNTGNGYNSSTGIFTAPVDGLYLFTTQMCMNAGKYITASIMVDQIEIGRAFTYDHTVQPCNTGDAIAMIKASQNVFVQVKYVLGNLFHDVYRWISFSGALLRKEH